MSNPLVPDPDRVRLAMLGMVEGNGHPFSWSAIINGRYDRDRMAQCGYPVIPQYLDAQPRENLGIPGVEVTHVWCDRPEDTQRVADCCFIPNRLARAEDAIGQVDAAVIATDIGHEHVDRARPFIEAGIPLFIDKPLTDNLDGLRQFIAWDRQGKRFLSSSAMRYSPPYVELRERLAEVGDLRLITMTMCKKWETYGIHALEGVYPFLRPGGWESVCDSGRDGARIVHAHHADGIDVLLPTIADMTGGFGHLQVVGTKGQLATRSADTFTAFKNQLLSFVDYLRTGERPIPFEQTVEQMKIVMAGIESFRTGGRTVRLDEVV